MGTVFIFCDDELQTISLDDSLTELIVSLVPLRDVVIEAASQVCEFSSGARLIGPDVGFEKGLFGCLGDELLLDVVEFDEDVFVTGFGFADV